MLMKIRLRIVRCQVAHQTLVSKELGKCYLKFLTNLYRKQTTGGYDSSNSRNNIDLFVSQQLEIFEQSNNNNIVLVSKMELF